MTKPMLQPAFRYFCIFLFLLAFTPDNLHAQPINDHWANASEIIIGNGGFDRGVFQSDTIDVTDATNEFGEFLDNPTYPKTIWYKFTIPTHRVVRIKVLQPTEALESTAAGFVVYEKTSSVPSASALAIFTPFYSFASYSENVCLEAGDYYIQAVAKNSANSNVFVELDIVHTHGVSHSEARDRIELKYNFGVIGTNATRSINWSCTSIDSEAERAHITGSDSLEYNKSTWFKFTTDNHIDLFHFRLSSWPTGQTGHIQIWKGDIDSTDVGVKTPIYQEAHTQLQYDHYLPCLLDTNTTYTIQLVAKESVTNTQTFRIGHIGEGETTGAYPQEADFHPNNQLGVISPLPDPGVVVTSHDYFSCASNLENDSIVCGTANPPDTAYIGGSHFELTTWFTFSTDAESNTVITTTLQRPGTSFGANHNMGYRIYNQTTDNDCDNYNYPADIYVQGVFSTSGIIQLKCLPPGDYAVQLLGKTTSIVDGSNINFSSTHLGARININLTSRSVPVLTFGLDAASEVDWINEGNPLTESVTYTADSAYFSCTKTVLPDTAICDPLIDRSIYRQLIIGDADGDAVPDSGMLVITGLGAFNAALNQASKSPFYKGDANALAIAQSSFSWPGTIDDLEPYDGCNMYNASLYYGYPHYYYADHGIKKYCVTPGTYTLASVGDSTENGLLVRPSFRFEKTVSQFSNPAQPEDLGDIIAQGLSVTSQDDYFSCLDNPDTIAGYAPCGGFTKQLYREFYVSQPCKLTVNSLSSNYPWSQMRLFSGRVSDVGIDGLSLAPFHSGGCYSGHGSGDYSVPACASVPAGWYTVVSYGFGPNYDNNYEFHETHVFSNYGGGANALYSIDEYDRVAIAVDTSITPGPFYNRPHKACAHPDTIKYVNTATEDFPSVGTSYTFCQEYFSSQTDTPMVNIPIDPCINAVRLAYYVFTTDEEYYATISGISSFYSELYKLDAREDSLLFPSTDPLISCESYPNNMTVCRLQPGTYTLVVYATASQQCVHMQPSIRVAPVDVSRFDWASSAYDFGLIPPDNTTYGGAVGDVHPTNTNYLPTNDFIYCTTGASTTDPSVTCGYTYYPEIYPDTINDVYFDSPGNKNENIRRNLWYTFVLQGTGNAKVQIRNLTNGWTPGFTIFKSDVDATLPYPSIIGTDEQDSTSTQGLTFITNNLQSGWCSYNKPETLNFQYFNDPCVVDSTYRRYYVLVEMKSGTPLPMQVDVQVTWDPIETNPQDPVYDYFYEANVLGAGEIAPPYSNTPLELDSLYFGGWGNLSCATTDTTDTSLQNCATLKTLWYKVIIDQPGFLYIGAETDALNPTFSLLEHVNAPDSIVSTNGDNGLLNYGNGAYANMNSIYSGANWRYFCLEPGTYYANLRTCNPLDTSKVRVLAYFEQITGNNCANAPFVEAPNLGVYNLSDPVQCHRIGDDFGEDGSDMGCLSGPEGYSSSWFKFSYTGTDLVDILFQLNLNSLYNYGGPEKVRYRLFYGDDCSTMIQGAECSVNAFINNSVACVSAAEGNFYVQVTYLKSATGTLGFKFTVSENTNPECNPFMPSLLTSDYVYQMNCDGDSLLFTNYSTSGSNLTYFWDFGQGNNTSTEVNPTFTYPNSGDYTVSLSVINPANQDTVTSSQVVSFEIGVSPLDLGPDQIICLGETATLGMFLSQATYVWSTGENTPEIGVQNAGDYFVDLTVNGCTYSDTVSVAVTDLYIDLGPDVEMCLGDTVPLAYLGTDNPNYTWSTGSADSSLTVTQAGTYWLEINEGNCTKTDTVHVVVHDLSFDLGNDTTICAGTSYYHHPSLPDGLSYNWSTGATIDSILIDVADTFSLEVGYAGCTATSEMIVSVLDLEVELGSDTTLCIGESLTLIPETNTTVNYLWNDGSTNSSLTLTDAGWYTVNVEAHSCHSADSILVSVLDLSFDLPEDTTICLGANINIDPQLSAGLNYTWNTGSSATTILTDTAGIYQLSVDSIGCTAQSEMEVSILDLTFSLGPDSTICAGESITLSPGVFIGETYLWSDNSTGTNLTVDTAGVYELEISKDGCSESDQVEISIFYVGALFPESLTACLHDTTLLSVTGADSLHWTSGQSDVTVQDELNFNFHPGNTGTYNWTAYENGCEKTGNFEFEVIQPYVANPVYDATYCRNELEIILPSIDLTTGTYSLEGNTITAIDIAAQGTSDFEVLYTYTDTNTCAHHITLDFSIVDTTTISFSPFDPICSDANALNLIPFLSHGLGQTSAKYDLVNWTNDSAFHTDSLQQVITTPLGVPVRYTYVNTANCQSVIDDEIIVHPLPVVAFSANAVCAGDTAVFTNTSYVNGSGIANQEWTFENNGIFSGSVTNNLVYNNGGPYEITLEVTSDIGCSASHVDSLEVMDLPILTADTFGPFCLNDGDMNLPIVSPTGGQFSMDNTTTSTFDTYQIGSGTHDYMYAFTDGNGCYNALTEQLIINDTTTISFNMPFKSKCIDSEEFSLKPYLSHPSGETFVKYDLLNWTADSVFHTENVAQNILGPRAIPVLYTYTNPHGCESVLLNEVTVHPLPVISVNVPDICANEMLVVSNNSYINGSGTESINWDIDGQGEFNTYQLAPMSFDDPGTLFYTINMTSEIGCYNADTSSFEIFAVPETNFDWDGYCENVPIEFTSSTTISNGSLTGFNWIMSGIENPGSSPDFDYLFPNHGAHEVGLTVTSDKGCTDTFYQNIYIDSAPVGGMILEDHCLNTKTTIISTASIAEGEIVETNWFSLGEIDTSSTGGLIHTFRDYGLKTIHQEVISGGGCISVYSAEVRVHPLPELSFEATVDSVCVGNTITLKNTSAIALPGQIASMEWTIDKNLISTDKTITFTGSKLGFTHIEITGISDFGCVSHLIDNTSVKVLPQPKSNFEFAENPIEIGDPTVTITDLSTNDVVDWTYDLGDGSMYYDTNPIHTYKGLGEYRVEQYVINQHGCSDASFRKIRVEGFIVFVPNAFTPDADGLNDIFKPSIYGEEIANYKFQIWNRNGILVFETDDVNQGWNGSSLERGYYSENTVFQYFVFVQGKMSKEPFETRGSVVLVR